VELTFVDATPVVVDDTPPELVTLGRAGLVAAEALAKGCRIVEAELRYLASCGIWKKSDVEALHRATRALLTSPLLPDAGFASIFARRLGAFDNFASGLWHNELGYWVNRSGALADYQELALVWNDWRPNERVPVDVGSAPPDLKPGSSGRLEWARCSDGPCISRPTDGGR